MNWRPIQKKYSRLYCVDAEKADSTMTGVSSVRIMLLRMLSVSFFFKGLY
jgi:hypothetical protein